VNEPLADLHPVVARVLAARGIASTNEIDPSLGRLPPPRMADIAAATERMARAHANDERILVVGDFDADGATSVALALKGLRALGFGHVDYLVPNRFEYGYGLTPELVAVAVERAPGLIVTVDNGISSHEGIAAAAAHGIDVIVTDHHLPGARLPSALAVIDPNRDDCPFPCKNLAGVGVVFYLLAALRAHLLEQALVEGTPPSLASFLDLVALGTVADLVPLDRTNRILVEQGLRRIRAGAAAPGVQALLTVARRDPADATAAELGYAAAPRLNAAGRLADMALGIETLLADDAEAACAAAARLDELNRERRGIEAEMRDQAEAELSRLRADLEGGPLPGGIVLHDPRWHQGVIGILAGRVREAVHRPTVVFASGEVDGWLKGSARSTPDLHMRDTLARISADQPHLIERFGGHAMAAGLQLQSDHLEAFRAAFAREVERAFGGPAPMHELHTDGALAPAELVLETAEALRRAGPWGAGFPEPMFDGEFEVQSFRTVGEHHLKLVVCPQEEDIRLDAIAFNADPQRLAEPGRRVRLVYRLDVNEYRGRRTPQLVIEYLERLE
jgi:single-stranded-DNA-specific exonuclease